MPHSIYKKPAERQFILYSKTAEVFYEKSCPKQIREIHKIRTVRDSTLRSAS